eukprot:3913003-Pyramimonas_sp.AAC.1
MVDDRLRVPSSRLVRCTLSLPQRSKHVAQCAAAYGRIGGSSRRQLPLETPRAVAQHTCAEPRHLWSPPLEHRFR